MKDSSDINTLHAQVSLLKMQEKSTEELISIWTEYNQKIHSKEDFEIIAKILRERIGELPPQRKIYNDPYKKAPEKKKTWAETKTTESTYFLSPTYIARRKEMATAFIVIISICLFFYCLFTLAINWS